MFSCVPTNISTAADWSSHPFHRGLFLHFPCLSNKAHMDLEQRKALRCQPAMLEVKLHQVPTSLLTFCC